MKKILLIEDDPDIQQLVRYSLGKEGFAVETCSDGSAGLLSARKDRPDLILLDVMLPGLTGNEVCRKLKVDRSTEAIPIIFLTARSDEIDKMIGFEIGADDYVSKPFSPANSLPESRQCCGECKRLPWWRRCFRSTICRWISRNAKSSFARHLLLLIPNKASFKSPVTGFGRSVLVEFIRPNSYPINNHCCRGPR